MGGLHQDVTESAIKAVLSVAGEVLSVRLQVAKNTQKCKGYAFVSFADRAAAEKASSLVQEVSGVTTGGA